MRPHERLDVWCKAMDFVVTVYKATESFPKEERFGLTSQIRRAAVSIYLPAGEVYCAPVAGTAEGKVVHTLDYYQGKEVNDLTLTVAGGKVTAMTGSGPGFDRLKADYDAAGEGRDVLSFVDLGINPSVKLPAASKLGTWVPAGTITVGLGNNTWAGGDDKTPYGYVVFLPGSTVTLDGKTIIENGQLKI